MCERNTNLDDLSHENKLVSDCVFFSFSSSLHFTLFFPLFFTREKTTNKIPPKKRSRTQNTGDFEEPVTQRRNGAKTEERMEKEDTKASSHLEERASHGDTEAMLMLAECNAYGNGMKQDMTHAEELMMAAASKGNKEAKSFMDFVSEWKTQDYYVDLSRL